MVVNNRPDDHQTSAQESRPREGTSKNQKILQKFCLSGLSIKRVRGDSDSINGDIYIDWDDYPDNVTITFIPELLSRVRRSVKIR